MLEGMLKFCQNKLYPPGQDESQGGKSLTLGRLKGIQSFQSQGLWAFELQQVVSFQLV